MMLKKSKEEVLSEIRANASSAILNRLGNINSSIRVDAQSMTYMLQEAIAEGIEEGFRTLLENRYTDDDFEKDMTLK